MLLRTALSAASLLVTIGIGYAQDISTGTVTRENFDPDSLLNPDSSLVQEWTIVNDPGFPAKIDASKFFGVTIHRTRDRGMSADIVVPIEASQRITAISVQLVSLNLWNEIGKTFDLTEVFDIDTGPEMLTGRWDIHSEAEAEGLHHLVVHVKQVRLGDGSVLSSDMAPVLKEIRKLDRNATEADIKPVPKDK